MVRTMTRTLVVLAVTLLGVSAFLQGFAARQNRPTCARE